MEPTNATFRPYEALVPNPKLRLRAQVHEVMRFKQMSPRTESAYWDWMRQYIVFHQKRHPREMSKAEVEQFLSYLAKERHVSVSTQNQEEARIYCGLRIADCGLSMRLARSTSPRSAQSGVAASLCHRTPKIVAHRQRT